MQKQVEIELNCLERLIEDELLPSNSKLCVCEIALKERHFSKLLFLLRKINQQSSGM